MMKRKFLLSIAILLLTSLSFAQNIQLSNEDAFALICNSKNAGMEDWEMQQTGINYAYKNTQTGIAYLYLIQTYKQLPVYNQLQVVAIKQGALGNKSGKYIADISRYIEKDDAQPLFGAREAIKKVAEKYSKSTPVFNTVALPNEHNIFNFGPLGVAYEDVTAQLMWTPYFKNGKQSVALTWQINFAPIGSDDYWSVRVNAHTNEIVDQNNFTVFEKDNCHAHHGEHFEEGHTSGNPTQLYDVVETPNLGQLIEDAVYKVIPYPQESPLTGTATEVSNPWSLAGQFNANAVTLRWHSPTATTDYRFTRGNNVWAAEDVAGANGSSIITPTGATAPSTTTTGGLNFVYPIDYTVAPTTSNFQKYAITNLFYWNNIMHNLFYNYGFDEVGGNFQSNNLSRGGGQGDYVIAVAQSGAGTNNANFATPADGSRPRMRMYLWSGTPQKDGDLDNAIIAHEYAHGISNRLTGGPMQAGCLSNDEQAGEGWSDYIGLMATTDWSTATITDGFTKPRAVGRYVVNQGASGGGIRRYRYSTNMTVDPLTYNNMSGTASGSESHNIGEIWCSALWDMTWDLIQTRGISPNLFDANATGGNVVALKLVMEGMKLQPCSPGFLDARDAILAADQLLYNGTNRCVIIKAFARRGMGMNASQGSSLATDDHVVGTSIKEVTMTMTSSHSQQMETQNVTYSHTISVGNCVGITNYVLRDTLPTNVTWVSGGTYDAATRVVSFNVTLAPGASQVYAFSVKINNGAYYPTVTYLDDPVTSTTLPSTLFANNTVQGTASWATSTTRYRSAPRSYFAVEKDSITDFNLATINPIAISANAPKLEFWHNYNVEAGYDGGILEISTNNGTSWTQVPAGNFLKGGYVSTMQSGTILAGKKAWTGSSGGWKQVVVKLNNYANQSIKFRFRSSTDLGTAGQGWYVDDIKIIDQPKVYINSYLYSDSSQFIAATDTSTDILQFVGCANVSISEHPQTITQCAGTNTTLSVTAGGTDVQYQWQRSTTGCSGTYTNIAGATSSTYTISNITAAMNGYAYKVVVSNNCPSTLTSNCAVLNVTTDNLAITTQPSTQTGCLGANVTFNVIATGAASYQWQKSTDGGTTWSSINGATTNSYSTTITAASANEEYWVIITSNCNPTGISSNIVGITISPAPAITTQPSNASGCAGSNVTFTAAASNANSYQWQSSNNGTTWTNIAGATNTTYTIAAITAAQNGNQFRLVATGLCGTATSNAATLTISAGVSITTHPQSATACANSAANFSVVATGASSYQWQVSTTGCGGTFTDIAGATTATYSIANATTAMNNNAYRVVVTNGCQSTNSNCATLTINNDNAAITTQPTDQSGCVGANATFSVTATGAGINYQWQTSTDNGATWTNIAGASATTYSAAITTSSNGNKFRVVITSNCNTSGLNSNAATLNVTPAPSITTQPANASGCAGSTVTFTAAASNANSYQWQVSTNNGTTWTNIAGATTTSYSINGITTAQDGNQYRMVATGVCGSATSNAATLSLSQGVSITAQPQNITVCANSGASFTVAASGASSYQWQVSTTGCSGTFTDIAGATTASYSIASATAAMHNYAYRVTMSNGCNTVTSNCAVLSVTNDPLAITTHPANQAGCVGASVSFSVVATGASINYQWQKSTDGGTSWTNITGANSANYATNIANESQNNEKYRVVLTSSCNSNGLSSNGATLTVHPGVSITTQPANISRCEGGNATFSVSAANVTAYQWQVSTDGGTTWNNIDGAITSNYSVTSVTTAMNNNKFRVTMASANCGSVNSDVATLTIGTNLNVSIVSSAVTASSATLTANVAPSGNYTYQWYFGGVAIATGASIAVDTVGAYTVAVYDAVSNCTVTSAVFNLAFSTIPGLSIMPSPNNGTFSVTYNNSNATSKRAINVYDRKGAKVFSKDYGTIQIMNVNITKYAAGIYLVTYYEDGKIVATGKVVKE